MKKISSSMLCLIILTSGLFAQCEFEDLFPFKFGASKYEVISQIHSNTILQKKNIYDSEFLKRYKPTGVDINEGKEWNKPPYLNGDSVLVVRLNYQFRFNPCYLTNDNTFRLILTDDKLYAYSIYLRFPLEQMTMMEENFSRLDKLVKKHFPNRSDFITKSGGQQNGESYKYFKVKYDITPLNPIYIAIDKKIKSDELELQITFTNLQVTKFNRNGFQH